MMISLTAAQRDRAEATVKEIITRKLNEFITMNTPNAFETNKNLVYEHILKIKKFTEFTMGGFEKIMIEKSFCTRSSVSHGVYNPKADTYNTNCKLISRYVAHDNALSFHLCVDGHAFGFCLKHDGRIWFISLRCDYERDIFYQSSVTFTTYSSKTDEKIENTLKWIRFCSFMLIHDSNARFHFDFVASVIKNVNLCLKSSDMFGLHRLDEWLLQRKRARVPFENRRIMANSHRKVSKFCAPFNPFEGAEAAIPHKDVAYDYDISSGRLYVDKFLEWSFRRNNLPDVLLSYVNKTEIDFKWLLVFSENSFSGRLGTVQGCMEHVMPQLMEYMTVSKFVYLKLTQQIEFFIWCGSKLPRLTHKKKN